MASINNISWKIYLGFRILCFASVFPVLSFCIKNPVSRKKLEGVNPNINVSSYLNYLSGQAFDSNMSEIEYSSVIQNASDFIEEDFVLCDIEMEASIHLIQLIAMMKQLEKVCLTKGLDERSLLIMHFSLFHDFAIVMNCQYPMIGISILFGFVSIVAFFHLVLGKKHTTY